MIGMPIFQMALFHSGLVYYLAVAKHNLIQNVIEIVLLFLSFLLFAHFLRIRFYFRDVHVTWMLNTIIFSHPSLMAGDVI